ncbi:hypothetical protein VE02_04374 [Pseudogymnoascus sp. 03VT05]|nr:hypothetical protein VE02_04374 [Pseudogymnoascus sp. 03VT05]
MTQIGDLEAPFDGSRLNDNKFKYRQANDATTRTFKAMVLKVLIQVNFLVILGLALGTLPQEASTALDTFFTNDNVNIGDRGGVTVTVTVTVTMEFDGVDRAAERQM